MLRLLHAIPGLASALLAMLLGITGAVLAIDPALERFGTSIRSGMSVAELAGNVVRHYPGAEQIERTASGTLIVYYSTDSGAGADRVNPADGSALGPHVPSAFSRWVKQLHRSLLLDTAGRAATGLSAVAMVLLCVTGMLLLSKRVGGWRRLARPLYGSRAQRWHAAAGRLVVSGLFLSALTGMYMSAATFGVIADGTQAEPDFPATTSGAPRAPVQRLPALMTTDLADLRELVFPLSGDRFAVYTLRTAQGDAYVDQSSGAQLSYRAHNRLRIAYELIHQLHTGQGLWWLGLVLGLCALGAPWLALSGAIVWWQRQRARPRIPDNSSAQVADTVILVGSENNSTWGFARALHQALRKSGRRVHTAPMNQLASHYGAARHLFVLTATYGDGEAPASASRFLTLLGRVPVNPAIGFSVLGFGDRQFPNFCQFAAAVDSALLAHGWRRALALATIDRQSSQQFERWGHSVGQLLGVELALEHAPLPPSTFSLRLHERVDYGLQEQEPTVVLRFTAAAAPHAGFMAALPWRRARLPRFEAGDLVGVIAPGSPVPRFYSLASNDREGILEICVRKHPAGICSGYLYGLQAGDCIDAFILPNPQFRPASGKAPVILIGAGTGIGPLAGFIRNNSGRHPMYLYWGGRDPESDFLYEPELRAYLADRRLTQLHTAFSRVPNGARVQTRLTDDADHMRELIGNGAQVLVCGSGAMAGSVRQALDAILAPLALNVQSLKAQGRYREDVF